MSSPTRHESTCVSHSAVVVSQATSPSDSGYGGEGRVPGVGASGTARGVRERPPGISGATRGLIERTPTMSLVPRTVCLFSSYVTLVLGSSYLCCQEKG